MHKTLWTLVVVHHYRAETSYRDYTEHYTVKNKESCDPRRSVAILVIERQWPSPLKATLNHMRVDQ